MSFFSLSHTFFIIIGEKMKKDEYIKKLYEILENTNDLRHINYKIKEVYVTTLILIKRFYRYNYMVSQTLINELVSIYETEEKR